MRIVIIRHAEPDYANNTLTEKGFREAEILGKYLQNEKFDKMYVSSLNRAKITAESILKYNNVPFEECDWLKEMSVKVDVPYRENSFSWDLAISFMDKNKNLFDNEKWKKVKGFDTDELQKRVKELNINLDRIFAEYGYVKNDCYYIAKNPNRKTIVFVCHFGIECYILSHILGISPVLLGDYTCSVPTGITTLYSEEREKGKAIFRLLHFGEATHLKMAGESESPMARYVEISGENEKNFHESFEIE